MLHLGPPFAAVRRDLLDDRRIIAGAMPDVTFMTATTDAGRLEALRRELARLVPTDAELVAAVAARAAEVPPRAGIRCGERTSSTAPPE